MNRVILIGNVGKDPVSATGTTQGAYFTMATSERWKVKGTEEYKERTTWHNIQVWGPFSAFVMKRVYKGAKLAIEGKISVTEYNDKIYHNVIADKIEVLSPKREDPRAVGEGEDQRFGAPPDDDPPPAGTQRQNPNDNLDDDDLPF